MCELEPVIQAQATAVEFPSLQEHHTSLSYTNSPSVCRYDDTEQKVKGVKADIASLDITIGIVVSLLVVG